jgi:hypothetical protein
MTVSQSSLITKGFSSTRLPTSGMMCPPACFRYSVLQELLYTSLYSSYRPLKLWLSFKIFLNMVYTQWNMKAERTPQHSHSLLSPSLHQRSQLPCSRAQLTAYPSDCRLQTHHPPPPPPPQCFRNCIYSRLPEKDWRRTYSSGSARNR